MLLYIKILYEHFGNTKDLWAYKMLSGRSLKGCRKGIKLTKEHKKKLSEAHIGKKFSIEHRQKLSEAQRKKPPVSNASRRKMSLAHQGKKLTEEHKQHISLGGKGKHPTGRRISVLSK
jgi:hypothetical protein